MQTSVFGRGKAAYVYWGGGGCNLVVVGLGEICGGLFFVFLVLGCLLFWFGFFLVGLFSF